MEKIISLFKRDYEGTHLVYDEVVEGAEWVVAGEGVATRKFDGSCCMVRAGKLYRRYDTKGKRTPPADFEPVGDGRTGWVPCKRQERSDKYFWEAFDRLRSVGDEPLEGTFELCGPKVENNPEGFVFHTLVRHGLEVLSGVPRTFSGIVHYFEFLRPNIEGVVWHHPDGRKVKIKVRDFGLKRRPAQQAAGGSA